MLKETLFNRVVTRDGKLTTERLTQHEYESAIFNTLFEFKEDDKLDVKTLFPNANTDALICQTFYVSHQLKKEASDAIFKYFVELQELYPLSPLIKSDNAFEMPFYKVVKNEDNSITAYLCQNMLAFTPDDIKNNKHWAQDYHAGLSLTRASNIPVQIQWFYDTIYFISVVKYLNTCGFVQEMTEDLNNHKYINFDRCNQIGRGGRQDESLTIIHSVIHSPTKSKLTVKKAFEKSLATEQFEVLSPFMYQNKMYKGGCILKHKNRLYDIPFMAKHVSKLKSKETGETLEENVIVSTEKKDTKYITDSFKVYHSLVSKNVNFFKRFKWELIFTKNLNEFLHPEVKTYAYRYMKLAKTFKMRELSLDGMNRMLTDLPILNKLMTTNANLFLWFMQCYGHSLSEYRDNKLARLAPVIMPSDVIGPNLSLNAVANLKKILTAHSKDSSDITFTEKMWKDFTKLNAHLAGYVISLMCAWLTAYHRSSNKLLIEVLTLMQHFKDHNHSPSLMVINRLFLVNSHKSTIARLLGKVPAIPALDKWVMKFIMANYAIAKKKRTVKSFCDEFPLLVDYWEHLTTAQLIDLFKRKTTFVQFVNLHNEWVAESIRVSKEFEQKQAKYEWHPLINEVELNQLKVEGLYTGKALLEEGKVMKHCVGTYISTCLKGSSRIFSVIEPKTQCKLATVEIIMSPTQEKFMVAQVRGYGNKMLDQNKKAMSPSLENKVKRTAHNLCDMLNELEDSENLLRLVYLNESETEKVPVDIASFAKCHRDFNF